MSMNVRQVTLNKTIKITLTAGAGYTIVPVNSIGETITAIPGGGGTMLIQYTTSQQSDIDAGTATWITWPAGSVAATTNDTLVGIIRAIRASATTANGTLEVCQ